MASDSLADDKYPMQEAEQLVIDAVNVGLAAMHKAPEKKLKEVVLGFMTALPTTADFISYESVTVICVCANTVKKPLSQAGREMNFAARSTRTSLMSTNQEKRKRGIKEQSIFLSGVNCRKNTRNQKAGKASWAQMQKLVQHCVYNGE